MKHLLFLICFMFVFKPAYAEQCILQNEPLTYIATQKEVRLYKSNNCNNLNFVLFNTSYLADYMCVLTYAGFNHSVFLPLTEQSSLNLKAIGGKQVYSLDCEIEHQNEVLLSSLLKERFSDSQRYISFFNDFTDRTMKCDFFSGDSKLLAKGVKIKANSWSKWIKNSHKATKYDCVTLKKEG